MKTLTTHKNTTTDFRGCEFSYTCYTQKDRVWIQETWSFEDAVEKQYVCNEFPEISAGTLTELKEKITAL